MKNADMPAMPIVDADATPMSHQEISGWRDNSCFGLTKREIMAMHVMTGLISGGHLKASDAKQMPELAVLMAGKLLAELERTNGQ